MAAINVRVDMDRSVEAMASVGEEGVLLAIRQAARTIPYEIRYAIFPQMVDRIADLAGDEAFPPAYSNHLKSAMAAIPIEAYVRGDSVEVSFNLRTLGGFSDFEAGFHWGAIIDTGAGKFVRHPPQVQFPPGYQGEKLLSEEDRRIEIWEEYVMAGGGEHQTGVGGGKKGNKTGDSFYIPSYEEVVHARVNLWAGMGVAPEWIILEYGHTDKSAPYFGGGQFLDRLEEAIACYVNNYLEAIVFEAVRIGEESGAQLAAIGGKRLQLRSPTSGQFVPSKGILNIDVDVDSSGCI